MSSSPLLSARTRSALTLICIGLAVAAQAAGPGPGLPSVTFPSDQLFTVLSRLDSTHGDAPGFHGIALLHDGYLVIPRAGTCCSGGGFNFYDISNPYAPALVKRIDEPTQREGHATGSSYFNGRKYVVTLASNGVNFWDWTDVNNPTLARAMTLPGITPSDYDTGAW